MLENRSWLILEFPFVFILLIVRAMTSPPATKSIVERAQSNGMRDISVRNG